MLLLVDEGDWFSLDAHWFRRMSAFPAISTHSRLIWQPSRCVTDVASFEGNAAHASALIERRLRQEGSADGEVRVLLHRTVRLGSSFQALFSCCSLSEWQRVAAYVARQRQRCAWIPAPSLAWSFVTSKVAVVLARRQALEFFWQHGERLVHVSSMILAEGPAPAIDAARSLGQRVRQALSEGSSEHVPLAAQVRWLHLLSPALSERYGQEMQDAFYEESGIPSRAELTHVQEARPELGASRAFSGPRPERALRSAGIPDDVAQELILAAPHPTTAQGAAHPSTLSAAESGIAVTTLPGDSSPVPARLTQNTFIDRASFVLDGRRGWASGCAALGVVLAFGSAASTIRRVGAEETRAAEIRAEAVRASRRDVASLAQLPASVENAARQLAFIESLDALRQGIDLEALILAIRDASPRDLRILSLRSETRTPGEAPASPGAKRAAPAAIVEAVLSDSVETDDGLVVSSFIRSLSAAGYVVSPIDSKTAAATSNVSSRLLTYRLTHPEWAAGPREPAGSRQGFQAIPPGSTS